MEKINNSFLFGFILILFISSSSLVSLNTTKSFTDKISDYTLTGTTLNYTENFTTLTYRDGAATTSS